MVKIAEIEFDEFGAHISVWTRDKQNRLNKTAKRFKHYYWIKDEEKGTHSTIFGDKVRKKEVHKFWEAKTEIKNTNKETYEDDLSYIKRFQIDNFDKIKSEGEPRIVFYDIETTGFSAEHTECISIVAYDSYTQEYTDFMWTPANPPIDTERKMLEQFIKYIKETDPDIITGWNSDRFDWPYLYERMEQNGLNPGKCGRTGRHVEPYHNGESMVYPIPGRINIDYLKVYKKAKYGEMDSYALDYVAKEELGVGKIDIKELPGELWEQGRDSELLRYNRRDVEIMVDLDKKLNLFTFLDKISDIASCSLGDTLYNSRIVDSYILKYTSKRGIILPSRRFNNKRRSYTGAKVLDPKVGIHRNVGIFDLASLYPSIYITFNLSPETMETEHRAEDGQEKGLIPVLLEDLFVLRRQYRSEGRDIEQRVVKEIMNSMYGVMALPTFRLYKQEVASAITKHGREIIDHTKEVVEEMGYNVIYGDTDSVFVSGIPNSDSAAILESSINERYDAYARNHGVSSHRLQIEFEAFSPVTLMVKKKRYAMRLDDGTNKIAGFQMKRSDTQPLARTMQEKVLNYILDGAKATEVMEWYDKMKDDALNGAYDIEIGIPRKFTKSLDKYSDGYAIRGALYANKHLGKNFGAGDKVTTYHIKNTDISLKATDAIALDYEEEVPPQFLIDRKKHWTRIEKALLPLLNDAKLIQKTKQVGLEDFL